MAEKKPARSAKKAQQQSPVVEPDYSDIDDDLVDLLKEVDEELAADVAEGLVSEDTVGDQPGNVASDAAPEEDPDTVAEDAAENSEQDADSSVADTLDDAVSEASDEADDSPVEESPDSEEPELEDGVAAESAEDEEKPSDELQDDADKGASTSDEPEADAQPDRETEEQVEPTETSVQAAPQKEEQEPKPGFFRRLWRRLFRKKQPQPAVMQDDAVPARPVDPKKELAKKQAALVRAQKIADRESAEAQKLQERLESQHSELERVKSWVEGLERSYLWNVRKTMASNLDRAHADLRFYEESVQNVELPERGDLVKHRMRFHKNFGIGLLIFGIPTALLFFIPWFAEATMPVWLLEFLNSGFFSVMVAGLFALTSGIVGIIRRAGGKEKMTWWRMVRITAFVAAIPMVIFGIARIQEWLLTYVVPVIDRWFGAALTALGVSFFFYVVGILAYYYSGWSQFSRQVTEQLTRLDNVEKGYVHSQTEIRRLEALYQQTSDWLELLAHSLYRPWKVDPDWETTNELKITSETFPFALRVAHAVDSETSQIANLERLIGQRLMTQGWRNEAFEHTLAEIGKQMGLDEDHVTPEFLDADLPHQTNNSRALIRSFFEQSAATAQKGAPKFSNQTGVTEDGHARFSDNYLVEVARRRLRELIEKTQSSVLSEARPAVEQIVDDPLQEIRFDSSVIDSKSTAQDWDDFLRDALGYEEVSQPPLSTMTFTDEGALAKAPESAQTHVLIPERLKASAPTPQSDSVTIHPLPDQGKSRSVELIVRLDVVGPVPFDHVRMVENATYRPTIPQGPVDHDDSEL